MDNLIITQTPFRISLGGGGTDLPFYSKVKGGQLIAGSINQYITVSISNRPLDSKILLQTTDVQFADNLNDIKNKIIREALRYYNLYNSMQVSTFSTLPSRIGLGTSSTLMVGLVKGLSLLKKQDLSQMEIGSISHHIEREILQLQGGIQDQYIAAIGGLQIIRVDEKGHVTSRSLDLADNILNQLQEHIILIYTGTERDSEKIIKSQQSDLEKTIEIYDQIKDIGYQSIDLLQNADIEGLGIAMDNHWNLKKSISNQMSNTKFDKMYLDFKRLGSPGGKIIGAGGGGFFLMTVPHNITKYKNKIRELGYQWLDWKFDMQGTRSVDL